MTNFLIPPYQPQGWHKPTESVSQCVESNFCQLLAFTQKTDLQEFNDWNALCDADGAVPIEDEICAFELFAALVDLYFFSDQISAQLKFIQDPEEPCSIMELIEGNAPEETENYEVTFPVVEVTNGDPGGVVWGVFDTVMAEGCEYMLSVTIEETGEAEAELSIAFGGNEVLFVETPISGSYLVTGTAGNDGQFTINSNGFVGTITINSFDVVPTFNPTGLRLSDGSLIGTPIILQREIVGNAILFQYQLSLTPSEFATNPCGLLEMAATCCGSELIYSECIKAIEGTDGTISIGYTSPRNAFGFVYAEGWTQRIRLRADVRFPSWRDEEEVSYIDSLGKKNLIYSEMRKQFELSFRAPEYVHDAMALAWKHPAIFMNVDGIVDFYRLVDGETYAPNWNRASKEANIILEVEKETQNLKNKYC